MTRDRVSGFLLLVLSLAYLYGAFQIELYPGAEDEYINAQTFPKAIGLGGALFAFLIMVIPRADQEGFAPWRNFDWVRPTILCVLMVLYGLAIKTAGFFLATSGFLLAGFLVLGERRPLVLLAASLPVAAGFQGILDGLLGIYIQDPFLEWLGIKSR